MNSDWPVQPGSPRPTDPERLPPGVGEPGRAPVLVLGIGNESFADDGLGVVAARRLAALGLPGVEVMDGGTLGLSLLPQIVDRAALLVLDAVVGGGLPGGEVVVLTGADLERCRSSFAWPHQVGLVDALIEARLVGRAPGRVAAVGIPPAELDPGFGLSAQVDAALGRVVRRALDQLAEWDVPVPAHLPAHPARWW